MFSRDVGANAGPGRASPARPLRDPPGVRRISSGRVSPGLQVNVTLFNVFDQSAATGVFYTPYRETLNLSNGQFFAGFDAAAAGAALQRAIPPPEQLPGSACRRRRREVPLLT